MYYIHVIIRGICYSQMYNLATVDRDSVKLKQFSSNAWMRDQLFTSNSSQNHSCSNLKQKINMDSCLEAGKQLCKND